MLIGLRFEVGADWRPYAAMFDYTSRLSLQSTMKLNDPGYFILNWLALRVGAGLWSVNLFCGAIFMFGLARLARTQERPWLSVLVAVPYLIIVVAMGYTRQSAAIGFMMAGLAPYLRDQSIWKLGVYFLVASLFHKTALLAFPLICLGTSRNLFVGAAAAAGITYFLYAQFLSPSVDLLLRNYIDRAYASQGAAIRVVMSVLPATLFFLNRKNLGFDEVQSRVWRNLSIATFILLGLLFVLSSSTVIDRLALYVIPLQLAVLPRLWKGHLTDRFGVVLVVLYCCIVQFAWLNFAVHSRFWVRYRFWMFA